MPRTETPVLLMKSDTWMPGDMPRSTSFSPESRTTAPVGQPCAVAGPWVNGKRESYDMTRANAAAVLPPSPKKAWTKLPELRAKVLLPRPMVAMSTVTPAHADKTTLLKPRPRSRTIRSVSTPVPGGTVAISQKNLPYIRLRSVVLISFSIRSVPCPANGGVLLAVGDVEYSANTESASQLGGVAPTRHTVATYWGRSDRSYALIRTCSPPAERTTLYVSIRKFGRSWRHITWRGPPAPTLMMPSCVPPTSATTIVSL